MTTPAKLREESALEALRRRYEADGYTVILHPSRDAIPSFLGAYRPDAVATRPPDEKLVIEVKGGGLPGVESTLAGLAERFRGQTEWRLRIVRLADFDDGVSVGAGDVEELRRAFAEFKALRAAGFARAAFLTGWSLLEGVARQIWKGDHSGGGRSTVERLVREGYVGQDDGRHLWQLSGTRNVLAHGGVGAMIEDRDLDLLNDVIEHLLDQASAPRPVGAYG
ncbi:hypothetical protein [Prosthecomicrobium hirschii]|uniref:hypothetical protein n=1 Tax=Prosthecodimorpha hirschii TaxID=665126 RepID=UPI00112E3016|nr:hypothetical protein [Prosthecomicrobium hirschii]MCW1840413.1 hypothetical protein [Prosthecomicrobium hirschii]TPQ47047.1 hypothetical protein C2U72_24865 [Prosthecomicrobium hirschii]